MKFNVYLDERGNPIVATGLKNRFLDLFLVNFFNPPGPPPPPYPRFGIQIPGPPWGRVKETTTYKKRKMLPRHHRQPVIEIDYWNESEKEG